MTLTPDELFDALGVALRPPPVEPSPGELAALHRMIDERCHDRVTARVPARRAWARPFVVAAAAAGIVVGSGAAAFAAGAPVPRPIRAVAHDVGLPVDSPELTDAKSAASDLRIVLGVNDTETISRARARLNQKLAAVPGDERGEIERAAKALLARADQQLRTETTQPAAGDDSPKSGGTAAGGSKSGSGSLTSGSGSTASGGAAAGSSGTSASAGSGAGPTSLPRLPLSGQPSGPAGSVVPASPSLPPPPPPPAPPVVNPPVAEPPVVAPVVATPVVATPPVAIATVATVTAVSAPVVTAPVVTAPVVTAPVVTTSPPVTSDLAV